MSYGQQKIVCADVHPSTMLTNVVFFSDPPGAVLIEPSLEACRGRNVKLSVTALSTFQCSPTANIRVKVYAPKVGGAMGTGMLQLAMTSSGTIYLPVIESAQLLPPGSYVGSAQIANNPMSCSEYSGLKGMYRQPGYGGEAGFALGFGAKADAEADFVGVSVQEKITKVLDVVSEGCQLRAQPPDTSARSIRRGEVFRNQIDDFNGLCDVNLDIDPYHPEVSSIAFQSCWGTRLYRLQALTVGACPIQRRMYNSIGWYSNGTFGILRSDTNQRAELNSAQQQQP